MAPGQKMGKRKPSETPLCAYEKEREKTMLRTSMALQRLGVVEASSFLRSTSQKATKRKASAPDSDPLFEPEDDDDDDNEQVSSGGLRLSKRVMAPHEQEQLARMTRQRTRELSVTEDGTTSDPLAAATFSAEPENDIQIQNEDEPDSMIEISRGINMGRGLDKLTRGLGTKIPVHIVEGKRCPEAPIQAAKLASEGGIIIRQQIPVLTHWKYYKKQPAHFANYIGKVAVSFAIDPKNTAVKEACTDLFRCGIRQMRHRLKKKYFDGVPANQVRTTSPVPNLTDEQWRALVEMWSDPKHKEKCTKKRDNRDKVQYQQRTGSCCYIAHCHALKEDKYKDVPPT